MGGLDMSARLAIVVLLVGFDLAILDSTPVCATNWSLERVANSGGFTAIAVDGNRRPHIAYSVFGGGSAFTLSYAHRMIGGTWIVEGVDMDPDAGIELSIAVDPAGEPGIVYRRSEPSSASLHYAKKVNGVWQIEFVDAGGVRGVSSIQYDAAGLAHVSYQRSGGQRYAIRSGSAWLAEIVDPDVSIFGSRSSLALGADEMPHVVYFASNNQELRYATKTGSSWTIELVDSTDWSGEYCSMRLDQARNVHVAYYADFSDGVGQLKYAIRTGGAWRFEYVDVDGRVGEYASLALDEDGKPHISYKDASRDRVKYAFKRGSRWFVGPLDASSGYYTSIAIDSSDGVHVSYYPPLKYAFASLQCVPHPETWRFEERLRGESLVVADVELRPNPPIDDRARFVISGVSAGAEIGLVIYDISGRQVAAISRPASTEGVLEWDLRDTSGQRLPAGRYLARARGGGVDDAVSFTLIR